MAQEGNYDSQIKYNDKSASIEYMLLKPERFFNVPTWQRSVVWPKYRQQRLINMILKNGFVPPVVFFPLNGDEEKLYILDGQQRLTAIRQFCNNEFKTGGTHNGGRPGEQYKEPNRYFKDLTEQSQKRILNFEMRYTLVLETNEKRLMELYIDIQNLTPLKNAEVMFASDSVAKNAAMLLAEHPYFFEVYTGPNLHKERYQSALYPLAITAIGPLTYLDTNKLGSFSNGSRDNMIGDLTIDACLMNLDRVCHLFKGVQTTSIAAIIFMYQAVELLNLAGYDLEGSQEGCLSEWLKRIDGAKPKSGYSIYSQIHKFGYQINFWASRLPELAQAAGLVSTLSREECYANIDRITSWMRHRAICPVCHKTGINITEIGDHAFRAGDNLDGCNLPYTIKTVFSTIQ